MENVWKPKLLDTNCVIDGADRQNRGNSCYNTWHRKVMDLQITGLDQQEIAQAAAVKFPGKYVEAGESDLYLPDIEKGKLRIEGIDKPVFASTQYAYEDKLVNGHKTRYKIPLATVLIKRDKYEVIYDSYGKYYVAFKDEAGIQFVLYEDFYELLKPMIHLEEEKNEQAT